MAPPAAPGARPRRILVIANETCASAAVVEEVRYRAGGAHAEVVVVAPVLAGGRMEHWLIADSERRRRQARARLDASLAALRDAGIAAEGRLGDADPLQALDDALRADQPDEVVIATHPPARSGWLERQVVRRARERYALPITHLVVDVEHETATSDADRPATGGAERAEGAAAPPAGLRLWHRTAYDRALEIRRAGFRDEPAAFEGADGRRGVFLVDREDAGAGEEEAMLFVVDLPEASAAPHELPPGPDGSRRFLVPATVLNRLGPPISVGEWAE